MISKRLLLVEDEPALVLGLSDRLRAEGYEIEVALDGLRGLELAASGGHDLVILDLMLPGLGGLDVCRELRRRGVEVPILMLTARREPVDRVVGLRLGADDYLGKPFDMAELCARVDAILRRVHRSPDLDSGSFDFGDVRVDFRRTEVTKGGSAVALSALEFRLLRFFIAHRGEMLGRERLLDEVWGYDRAVFSRTVDQHVAALRRKLEERPNHPRHFVTVHGLGYRFTP